MIKTDKAIDNKTENEEDKVNESDEDVIVENEEDNVDESDEDLIVENEEKTEKKNPETGSFLSIIVCMLGLILAGVVFIIARKKRKFI